MFTYITLGTDDLARAARFYDAVLGALGQTRAEPPGTEEPGWIGWGRYEDDGRVQLARIFHACSQRRAQRGIAARI